MAFSFSMTPLMNSPSARRSVNEGGGSDMGLVTGVRVGLSRCASGGESLEDLQERACRDSLREASVREDLWLGGFMARIVIKPNS